MSMTLNFLGGAPFQLLYDGVKLAMSNTRKFRTHLRNLKFTLDCLQPQIIEQIRLQNLQLNIPVQEIQELQRKIEEGIVLVGQLSSINTCNIRIWGSCCNCLMVSYANQLDELDESLRRLLEILRLQSLAHVNQIGILARNTRDRQDELGRRQMEVLNNQRQILNNQQHILDALMKQQQMVERIENNGVAASTGNEGAAPVLVVRLGEVFQAQFDAVVQVKGKNSKFKRLLENFKFTLDCLKPLVQEIVGCNKVLHFPKGEILEELIAYLEKGVELVYKCSKSSLWNRFKRYEYNNSLFELDESLQRLFNILRLQLENDVNDALVSVSKLEKEIKEIEESLVLQHHQYESAAAEPQLPKVELDVMNMQETKDVKGSMDSVGDVQVGDGSCKQGSSLALHRIDVAVEEPSSPTILLDVNSIHEILDSTRNNMEVGPEETGEQGDNEGEAEQVPCKAVEQETVSTSGTSEIQSRNRVSQTISSTGRSRFSSKANTSSLEGVKLSLIKLASLIEVLAKKGTKEVNLRSKLNDQIEWLPDSIGKLSSLLTLDLSENRLLVLPSTIGGMSSLTKLDLHSNRLAELPDTIGDLLSLVHLDLRANNLAALPASFGRLVCLVELDLSYNRLALLPDTIGSLASLKVLNVETNEIDEISHSIGHCTKLKELHADYNKLKALPEAVGKIETLEILSVRYNNIKQLPTTMSSLLSLRELDVSFNELESVPESLCFATTLVKMNIGNNFADMRSLPRSIGNLEMLEELDMSNNQIRVLPDSFRMLTRLRVLRVEENPLEVPPRHIAEKGAQAVVQYMAELVEKREVKVQPAKQKKNWAQICFFSRSNKRKRNGPDYVKA